MKFKHFLSGLLVVFGVLFAEAQLLYKIEGNGLMSPSYIFGTHHLAPLSKAEQTGAFDYLDEVDSVVGELDMTVDEMTLALSMQPYMIAPSDSVLSKVISAEEFEKINSEFKNIPQLGGLDLKSLEMMKPMVISSMVSVALAADMMEGFDNTQQIDGYFQKLAQEKGKKVMGLETPALQAEMLFNSIPISVQAGILVDLLSDIPKTVEMTKRLTEAYMSENLEELLKISDEEDDPTGFMAQLLDKRNSNWIEQLPSIMKEGPVMIVVGALHLPGDKGVIEGLRKAGFTITPVKNG